MSDKTLTPEAVKEQFCTEDKREALEGIRENLETVWDIDKTMDLAVKLGARMEKETAAAGVTWTPMERIAWVIKEAFILGSLDAVTNMMIANDLGYEALTGEVAEA